MKLTDFQQLIEQIQSILTWDNDPSEDELRQVAARYSKAVALINKRLAECDDCLHRGLRAEALQIADVEPNLLDAFSVLDFPELPAWNDYIGQFEIDRAPELALDSAAELNEAYSTAEPVEKLLQKHRLQALARASLADRTQTLRELTRIDDNNRIWKEDLAEYEQHRLALIQKECEQAARNGAYEHLATLERELQETSWLIEVPSKLKSRIRREHDRLRAAAAYVEMKELALQLSDAFSSLNLQQGRTLYARWSALLRLAQVDASDEVFDLAGPALDWLQEEAAREQNEADYRAAVQKLESLLDEQCDRETLDRTYHLARGFDRELSPVLEHRVVERFRTLEAQARQRRRLIVFTVVSVLLGTTGLVTFFVQRHVYAQEVARHARQFESLIDQGNLTDARSYLQTLEQTDPEVSFEPEISGLAAKLREAERTEEGRLNQLDQLIAAAEDVQLQQPAWDDIEGALKQLEQAEQIARTPAEKARTKQVERDVVQIRREMQEQIDSRFREDLDGIQMAIDKLDGTSLTAYSDVLKRLREVQSRPHVGTLYLSPVAGLIAKVKQEQAEAQRRQMILADLQKVTDSLGNLSSYTAALREFADKHPDTTRSSDFERLLSEETDLWSGVDKWMNYRGKWKVNSLKSLSAAGARKLLEDHEAFLQTSGPYPGATELMQRLDAAQAIARRQNESKTGALDSIEKLLTGPQMEDILIVPVGSENYYTDEIPMVTSTKLKVKYFVDQSFGQKNETTLSASLIPGLSERQVRSDWYSPQTRFAKEGQRIVSALGTVPWEESFGQMTERLLAEKDMDSVLQLALLEIVLKQAASGSVFLQDSLKEPLNILASNRLKTVNWTIPKDDEAVAERRRARTLLISIGTLGTAFKRAADARDLADQRELGPEMHWVGWLYREPPAPGIDNSEWVCSVSDRFAAGKSGDLMVLYATPQSQATTAMAKVGTLNVGRVELDRVRLNGNNASPEIQIEGRPVFMKVLN